MEPAGRRSTSTFSLAAHSRLSRQAGLKLWFPCALLQIQHQRPTSLRGSALVRCDAVQDGARTSVGCSQVQLPAPAQPSCPPGSDASSPLGLAHGRAAACPQTPSPPSAFSAVTSYPRLRGTGRNVYRQKSYPSHCSCRENIAWFVQTVPALLPCCASPCADFS